MTPALGGVPETMLWALHNRATEARRAGSVFADPDSVRIHAAIDYDFQRRFGEPLGSLAGRAAEIDRVLRRWLERHPDGMVVSLGEGLETQVRRVDNGRVKWLSVDLADAIRVREHFIAPSPRFRHLAADALDGGWMDEVDVSGGVFIVAQGLLMYLDPARVEQFFGAIGEKFPGAEMVFDVVPRWFSQATLAGLNQTPHYRLPPMPWGIDRNDIEPTLRDWNPAVSDVTFLDYPRPKGMCGVLLDMARHVPVARHSVPSLVHVLFAPSARALATTSVSETTPRVDDLLAMAAQNTLHGGDIARASSKVVARRMALGVAAAFNPGQADHAEFSRMVPEKIEAFSAAGRIMLEQSGRAGRRMARVLSDEMSLAGRAAIDLARCSAPDTFFRAQARIAGAWYERAAARCMSAGLMVLAGHAAALAPIRATVVANAERLGG